MIPGFNHNVKYKGKMFHCQTEDSGVANPHIITHLFVGGNILATRKTSYADIVKSDRLEEVVVELMQDQHKEMLKRLLSGSYDTAIEERAGNAAHLDGPAPLNVDAGAQHRASVMAPAMGGSGHAAPRPAAPSKPAAPPPVASPVASKPAAPAPVSRSIAMPATPKPAIVAKPPPAPAPRPAPMPSTVAQEVIDAQNLSIVPTIKPASGTIFGEDMISEKSLDEVILSYLSTEVER